MVGTISIAGCGKPEGQTSGSPQPLTRQAISAVDGMILLDYPGPKGQMVKKDAAIDYFCDVPELINAVRDPDHAQAAAQAYVQAFDGRQWGSYRDGWVEVSRPLYVLGSDRMGAMGPTLVPFLTAQAARAFIHKHGGRMLRFSELTPEVMAEHARMSRDMLRQGGMAGHMMGHMHGHEASPHAKSH
jgi:copper chaperone NosL